MPEPTGAYDRRGFLAAAAASVAALHPATPYSPVGRARVRVVDAAGAWIPTPALLARLPSLMRIAGLPGLAMAVVEDGTVAWTHAAGLCNATTTDAVTDATLFEAASISKPVFAYAVLQLADEGRLGLDTPLVRYYTPPYLPDDPRIAQITARHVLTHSSGLPNWGVDEKPASFAPTFAPGTRFSYSGEGYFWLQLVVEALTGQGLNAAVRALLFEPAGMGDTAFVGDVAQLPRMAYGHVGGRVSPDQGLRGVLPLVEPLAARWHKPVREWSNADWVRAAVELFPTAPVPTRERFQNAASSLITTASDYARFLTLLMERPRRGPWALADATRRAMIAPQVAVQAGLPFWWGLGWTVERASGGWRVSHEGNNDDRYTSYAGFDPARRRGLVVLTNGGSGFGVYQRLVRATTGLDQLSFVADLHPGPA